MLTIIENLAVYLENNYKKFYGIEEGMSNELLIRLLSKRFDEISDDVKGKIMNLPINKVNEIGEGIFDFENLEDIIKLL